MSAQKHRSLAGKATKNVIQRFSDSAKAIPNKAWQQWASILYQVRINSLIKLVLLLATSDNKSSL